MTPLAAVQLQIHVLEAYSRLATLDELRSARLERLIRQERRLARTGERRCG